MFAIGDGYTQGQYLIASEASTVMMHDYGSILLTGYGRYRTYFQEALQKLKVTTHIFRVGTYKSALEPYLRNDMSPEAREANLAFLDSLWVALVDRVAENRGQTSAQVLATANGLPALVAAQNGDVAKAMLEAGLVDKLADRADQIAAIAEVVGEDEEGEGFKGVGYQEYLTTLSADEDRPDIGNISIVTVAGAIVDGEEAVEGSGGDYIARQLREAREDDNVKAVVLRVDSPGGSAFASEIIRDEIIKVKASGRPVVVSMGSLAASGGYWVSANADEIYAAPTTLTGSIGVFSMIPTFENTMAEVGVYSDGVGTTGLSAISGAGVGPLPEEAGQIIQSGVEFIYTTFLNIVADGRGMSVEAVSEIAEGRVWMGDRAAQAGLVDKFGTFDDAIKAAAARAELEDWDVVRPSAELSPFQMWFSSMSASDREAVIGQSTADQVFGTKQSNAVTMGRVFEALRREAAFMASFNDPNAVYVRCLECRLP